MRLFGGGKRKTSLGSSTSSGGSQDTTRNESSGNINSQEQPDLSNLHSPSPSPRRKVFGSLSSSASLVGGGNSRSARLGGEFAASAPATVSVAAAAAAASPSSISYPIQDVESVATPHVNWANDLNVKPAAAPSHSSNSAPGTAHAINGGGAAPATSSIRAGKTGRNAKPPPQTTSSPDARQPLWGRAPRLPSSLEEEQNDDSRLEQLSAFDSTIPSRRSLLEEDDDEGDDDEKNGTDHDQINHSVTDRFAHSEGVPDDASAEQQLMRRSTTSMLEMPHVLLGSGHGSSSSGLMESSFHVCSNSQHLLNSAGSSGGADGAERPNNDRVNQQTGAALNENGASQREADYSSNSTTSSCPLTPADLEDARGYAREVRQLCQQESFDLEFLESLVQLVGDYQERLMKVIGEQTAMNSDQDQLSNLCELNDILVQRQQEAKQRMDSYMASTTARELAASGSSAMMSINDHSHAIPGGMATHPIPSNSCSSIDSRR